MQVRRMQPGGLVRGRMRRTSQRADRPDACFRTDPGTPRLCSSVRREPVHAGGTAAPPGIGFNIIPYGGSVIREIL